jgi:hypothetical protein
MDSSDNEHTTQVAMSHEDDISHRLHRYECVLGYLLLTILAALHVTVLFSAGGLWRDEVNTVQLSNLANLADIWPHLQFDSFPIVWFLLVRVWTEIFGQDWYRWLGFIIGLGIVWLLCLNSRRLGGATPLIALLLLALNPAFIRYGDSMRAYGFGIGTFIVTFGLIWRVVTAPTRLNVLAATVAAVLSVQALYYNAVLLLAVCAGGAALALRHKQWPRIGLLIGIGLIAAVSLLPYSSTIRDAAAWNGIVQMQSYDLPWFWAQFSRVIGTSGDITTLSWILLSIIALLVGFGVQVRPGWFRATPAQVDLALFSVITLVVGSISYFIFLKILSYYATPPWYYFALMALVAINLDILITIFANLRAGRIFRLTIVVTIILSTFGATVATTRLQHSNIDIISGQLKKMATSNDLILVNVWYYGIPFAYYFTGSAPWMTLPPISDHRFHRYDQVKDQMLRSNPSDALQPALDAVSATLRSGHTVWVVGDVLFLRPGETPQVMPQGSIRPQSEAPYYTAWGQQMGSFLQLNASRIERFVVSSAAPMGPYEDVGIIKIQGWNKSND